MGLSISMLCERVDVTRQNYCAARHLRQQREINEAMVVELVKRERRMQPRLGERKLLHLLRADLGRRM